MNIEFTTADLYDANEGKVQVALPIFNSYGVKTEFCGQIFTIKCHEDNSLVGDVLRNENGHGKVLVIDGGGSLRYALVGDLIAAAAVKNHWEGIIVYGCIRDSAAINEMNIGIRALQTNPSKTVKRNTGLRGEIINFANVNFCPNHWVYVDADGILISELEL